MEKLRNDLQDYLANMLAHIDDMAKKTIFMMGVQRGMQEAQKEQSQNNGGTFSTNTEEKMLIDISGVSINAKPRSDGRYQGYALRDGEKKYFYGKTPAEVQKKIQDYLNSAPAPKRKKRNSDTSPLFEVYAAQWVEQYKKPNLKPKSLETLHFSLKKAVDAFQGKTIGSITTDDLQRFFTSLPPSRSRDLCSVYVGQLFKKAFVTSVIKKNPFEQVEIKKHAPQKRSALTLDEQAAFLAVAKSSVHFLLYRFLLSSGLRIGEALALSPADLKDGKVNVSKDIVFLNRKEIIQPPKSKAAFRSVPVPQDIYDIMQKVKTERIFPCTYAAINTALKKLSKKLGFTVSAHILRHTYATRLEEAGIPPKIKQYLLGHATIDITQNVYTDAQSDYINSVSDKIRAVFDTK